MEGTDIEMHPAAERRQRIAKIGEDFRSVPVKHGTQQARVMQSITESAQILAKQIAEFCPAGSERETALARVLEAKFWATHAIAHRGATTDE